MPFADKDKLNKMSDPALMEEFKSFSNGSVDAGMPVKLDSFGLLDLSFLDVRVFNLIGEWTPASGNEYPAPADSGDYWIIEGVGDINSGGYTFTSGYLNGRIIYDDEMMVKGRDDHWGIIHLHIDPNVYYRLDGTKSLSADFQTGGHKLVSVADGVNATDGVNKGQLDTKLNLTGKAADSDKLDGIDSASFLRSDVDATFSEMLLFTRTGSPIRLVDSQSFIWGADDVGGDGWFIGRPHTDGLLKISNYHGSTLTFPEPSGLLLDNNEIWHAGNFTPASKENALGNPSTDGYILSSTAAGARSWIPPAGGGGSVDWGQIGGTLSNQTDLQSALDDKQHQVTISTSAPSGGNPGDIWMKI
jgi:hypothetical protein